jgi:hypothetical protein
MMKKLALFLFILALGLAACQPAPAVVEEPSNDGEVVVEEPSDDGEVATPSPDSPVGDSDMPDQSEENPYAPLPGDANLVSGNVYIDRADLLTLESYPLQFTLSVSGNLPDPCHHLRVSVSAPDSENRIDVQVYSLANPETMCIQVLEPFDVNIPLGSFPTGEYELYLNGEKVAEFQS